MAMLFAAVVLATAFSALISTKAAILISLFFLLLGLSANIIGAFVDRAVEIPNGLFARYLPPLVMAACLLSDRFIDDTLSIVDALNTTNLAVQISLLVRVTARVCSLASIVVVVLMSCTLIIELPARWIAGFNGLADAIPFSAARILIICAILFLAGSTLTQLVSIELNPQTLIRSP